MGGIAEAYHRIHGQLLSRASPKAREAPKYESALCIIHHYTAYTGSAKAPCSGRGVRGARNLEPYQPSGCSAGMRVRFQQEALRALQQWFPLLLFCISNTGFPGSRRVKCMHIQSSNCDTLQSLNS